MVGSGAPAGTTTFETAPLGTVTLLGVPAADMVSLRVTRTPPAGAGCVNVTVPVTFLQLATTDLFSVRFLRS